MPHPQINIENPPPSQNYCFHKNQTPRSYIMRKVADNPSRHKQKIDPNIVFRRYIIDRKVAKIQIPINHIISDQTIDLHSLRSPGTWTSPKAQISGSRFRRSFWPLFPVMQILGWGQQRIRKFPFRYNDSFFSNLIDFLPYTVVN